MSFLHDIVSSQSTTSNLIVPQQDEETSNQELEEDFTPSASTSSNDCSFTEPQPRKRKFEKVDAQVDIQLLEYLKIKKTRHESANDLFCRSIAKNLDELTEKQQHEARIKIQQLIFNIKYEQS